MIKLKQILTEQDNVAAALKGVHRSQYIEKPQLVEAATKKVEQSMKDCTFHLKWWKIGDPDVSPPPALKELREIDKHLKAAKLLLAKLTKDYDRPQIKVTID